MRILDRLLTIVVTVTLTSAAWILFGTFYFADRETSNQAPKADASRASDMVKRGKAVREAPVARVPTQLAANDLVVPVAGVRIEQLTDTFTDKRGGGSRLHEALDIMAPRGTPVVAAAPGTVEKLFESDQGGLTVYQRSPDKRTLYYYAHLDRYAPNLKEGDALIRGDPIGTVGSTGNADPAGPHLHFAVMRTTADAKWWEPGTALDPYRLLTGQ